MAAFRLLLAALLVPLVLGAGGGGARLEADGTGAPAPPARRRTGPRVPAPFGGRDPATLGLVKVEGLLWIPAAHLAAWRPGGRGLAPPEAGETFALRTDHVLLRTDLSVEAALPLAALAQRHVEALLKAYGDTLDLRLPAEPLPITVHARRAEFVAAMRSRVGEPPAWNAWYDAQRGVVEVSHEPAREGALPLAADVRHELTHAVLDLSAFAPVPHERIAAGLYLWLWEGVAVHSEGLGEVAGGAAALRRERRRAREARDGPLPLATLLALDQERIEGRHYDALGDLLGFLLAEPQLGSRTLDLLRRLLRGDVQRHAPEREWEVPLAEVERRWRASPWGTR